jgi:hypothetical protein
MTQNAVSRGSPGGRGCSQTTRTQLPCATPLPDVNIRRGRRCSFIHSIQVEQILLVQFKPWTEHPTGVLQAHAAAQHAAPKHITLRKVLVHPTQVSSLDVKHHSCIGCLLQARNWLCGLCACRLRQQWRPCTINKQVVESVDRCAYRNVCVPHHIQLPMPTGSSIASLTFKCVALRAPRTIADTPGCCSTHRAATTEGLTPCFSPISCSTCSQGRTGAVLRVVALMTRRGRQSPLATPKGTHIVRLPK